MPKYYAVRKGRNPGIYQTWDDCKAQTNGYSNAKFKGFNSLEEANSYINGSDSSHSSHSNQTIGNNTYLRPGLGSLQPSKVENTSIICRLDIYTDGACPNNGYGGAKGGLGVHFPDFPQNDLSEPLSGRQTNNRAEIMAVVRALQTAKQMGYTSLRIHTDSNFIYRTVNEWIHKWSKNGWKKSDGTDVINREDFIHLLTESKGMDIEWVKVAAHKGIPGNEEADRLANRAIGRRF